jgi:NlpB/DapX lipoprotein
MQQKLISLLIIVFLVSCASEDSRYRDTTILERPPTLVIEKSSSALYEADESSIPKKQEPGLGEAIYLTSTTPQQLKIKQPFDKAWDVLIQGVKLNEIKITDQERNKGHLYVSYDSSGFFDKVTSFMKDERKGPIYLLTIEDSGDESTVTATLTNPTEQTTDAGAKDGYYEKPADDTEALIETLYKTIHDDLVEE